MFARHCQTNLSGPAKGAGLRRSGRQLTPLGQGRRTVLGEGKYGGLEQALILANSGPRPLLSILQNVIDAWHVSMGWPLPEIGEVAG